MYKLEQKEMRRKSPVKNSCYDWLINLIPEPIRKTVGGFEDKVVSLFKRSTLKIYIRKKNKTKQTQKQK